jgi:hypothetical protein
MSRNKIIVTIAALTIAAALYVDPYGKISNTQEEVKQRLESSSYCDTREFYYYIPLSESHEIECIWGVYRTLSLPRIEPIQNSLTSQKITLEDELIFEDLFQKAEPDKTSVFSDVK